MKNPVYPSVCIIRSVVKKKKSLSENYAEVYKKNTKILLRISHCALHSRIIPSYIFQSCVILYIIKIQIVRSRKVKYVVGLCVGFTNLLCKDATSPERKLYLAISWLGRKKKREKRESNGRSSRKILSIFKLLFFLAVG